MPSTERRQRQIDKRLDTSAGGTTLTGSSGAPAGPAVPTPPAPQGLTVTGTKLLFSAVSPMASASLLWRAPVGVSPQRYLVQWATTSGFAGAVTRVVGVTSPQTTEIDGLPVNTPVYFRVAAVVSNIQGAWSAAVSTTTPADTTAPAAPTSLVTAWSGLTGDLEIRWTNPTSVNLRDVRVRIYASNGGALLREVYSATGRYVWTRGQHYADTSGSYDASVYLVLTARSWGGVFSAADLTGTATLAAPTTPAGLTSSWAGDTGTAGANCLITWTQSAAVAGYRLTIDGVARDVGLTGRYDYPFAQNQAEHAGTPDPVLSLSLVAVDALGQTSTAATATATNAAPPATTVSVFGAFDRVQLTIAASAALDLQDYRVRVYLNGSGTPATTFYTAELRPVYLADAGSGSYRFDVSPRDVFGQVGTASALTTAQTLEDQAAFIADLRAGVVYRDSISTSPATLSGLKDGDTAVNVVTYTASTPWRWTEAIRAFDDRHRTATLSTSASASYYYGVSADGATYTYYAGGTATGGVWSPVAQASEAAAQSAATTLAAGVWRVQLPATVEGRYFRLGHRNTSASYALREFYPRALVEADDIRVENLAAISANMGDITAGSLTSVTITGATIRTSASNPRLEMTSSGLTSYDGSGVPAVEILPSSYAGIRIGQGAIGIERNGLDIRAASDYPIQFYRSANGTEAARFILSATGTTPTSFTLDAVNDYTLVLSTSNTSGGHSLTLGGITAGVATAAFSHNVHTYGGLSVGALASPSAGQIRASREIITDNEDANTTGILPEIYLRRRSTGTPAAGFGAAIRFQLQTSTTNERNAGQIAAQWIVASDGSRRSEIIISAWDAAAARPGITVGSDGTAALLGFFGSGGYGRPTITGSRGGNVALANLLAELANLGLIVNSTT